MYGLFRRLWRDSRTERFLMLEGRMREAWEESEMPVFAELQPAEESPPPPPPSPREAQGDRGVDTKKRKRGANAPVTRRSAAQPGGSNAAMLKLAAVARQVADGFETSSHLGGACGGTKKKGVEDPAPHATSMTATMKPHAEAGQRRASKRWRGGNGAAILEEEEEEENEEEADDLPTAAPATVGSPGASSEPPPPSPSPLTCADVNVNTRDGLTVALLVGGDVFYVHRRVIDTHSPFLRDVLADADAAAEAATFSPAARALQLDPIPFPAATGLPTGPMEMREVFRLAMQWLYTGRRPRALATDAAEERFLPPLLALAHVLEASALQEWCAARLAHHVAHLAACFDQSPASYDAPPILTFGTTHGPGHWAACCALEGPVPAIALLAESAPLRRALAFWAATRLGGAFALPAAVAPYRELLEGTVTELLCGLPLGGPPLREVPPTQR